MEFKVDSHYINKLQQENLKKPFLIVNINGYKKIIHSIETFIKELKKRNIIKVIFDEEHIILVGFNEVFYYKYGKYIPNMEKI